MNPPTDYAARLAAVDHAHYADLAITYGLILALLALAVWALASLPWTAQEQTELQESLDSNARALGQAWAAITRGSADS